MSLYTVCYLCYFIIAFLVLVVGYSTLEYQERKYNNYIESNDKSYVLLGALMWPFLLIFIAILGLVTGIGYVLGKVLGFPGVLFARIRK